MKTRRDAMKAAAASAAAFPILGAPQHQHQAAGTAKSEYKPRWATPAEMEALADLCERIIPRTDTPGARDALVHEYIEFHVSRSEQRRRLTREGLKWYASFSADERVPALQKASAQPRTREGRFFKLMKDLTIDGYYSASREGLEMELGWKGNTYLPEFEGCTHPEHQG